MNISSTSASSISVAWQSRIESRSGPPAQAGQRGGNDGDADDSVAISAQGMAAYQASQNGAAPPTGQLTDARAAKIGARLQAKHADLFNKLDTDGDGSLNASELKAGKSQIREARAADFGAKLQQQSPDLFKALDGDGNGTLSAAELKAGRDALAPTQDGPTGEAPPPEGAPPPPGGSGGSGAAQGHHHHRHHDESGGQAGGSSAGSATTSSSGTSTAQALQSNTIADALQSLFAALGSSTTPSTTA